MRIRYDRLKPLSGFKILMRRNRFGQPQQGLGRQDDQRQLPGLHDLRAEQMKIVGRRRRIHQPDVFARTKLQQPFDTSRGMLWPLPFETMRQQHDEAGILRPLRPCQR